MLDIVKKHQLRWVNGQEKNPEQYGKANFRDPQRERNRYQHRKKEKSEQRILEMVPLKKTLYDPSTLKGRRDKIDDDDDDDDDGDDDDDDDDDDDVDDDFYFEKDSTQ
ncbi:hypothetical protein GQR58_017832 [Nymphon striatum]|nr:hypothetical protein GQR58_017832 [Nymphon striatum]